MQHTRTLTLAIIVLGSFGCSAKPPRMITPPPPATDAGPPPRDARAPSPCSATPGETICISSTETVCTADGNIGAQRDCATEALTCAPGLGCRACTPGRGRCAGETPSVCLPDGSGWVERDACNAEVGETCNAATGICDGPCALAAASHSYLGCEYFPVTTMNSLLPEEFTFAVVVANPNERAVSVTVDRGPTRVASATVEPGAVGVIELPWVEELRARDPGEDSVEESALVRHGAYRLRSTLPVTAYQFNPLDFRIPRDCADELSRGQLFGDGTCNSFTNDASLLLPSHALTGSYVVLSWPSRTVRHTGVAGGPLMRSNPGFFTVVGADIGPVDVRIKVTAFVEASADGMVRALRPGDEAMFTLAPGDVVQLATKEPTDCAPGGAMDALPSGVTNEYCNVGPTYDLTGTEVRATGRVEVISGHSCAFVPSNRFACDHLEESVYPLEAWGREAVISITRPLRSEPNLIRVVSGHDGNVITFEPASVHAPVTLARGASVELETGADFRVTGTEPFAAMQFLVGQDYEGPGMSGWMAHGDPSLSLAIPSEQFRSDYTFLAPQSYLRSFVNVTAPVGVEVRLDDVPIATEAWTPLAGTGMTIARLEIPAGAHHITAASPFGIIVYGFGEYTSYMYPGGLDLEPINPPF